MRALTKKLLIVLGSLVAAAAMLELVLARAKPQPTFDRVLERTMGVFEGSPILPYRLRPSSDGRLVRSEFHTFIDVSSDGFRGPELRDDGAFRILVVGDSFTFGWGVEDDETYPARLQDELDERLGPGRTEVINAGFAACYYPDTYYLWLKEVGLGFEPDLVVVGFFVGNDVDHDLADENAWVEVDEQGLPTKIRKRDQKVEGGRLVSRVKHLRYRIPVVRNSHLAQAVANLVAGPAAPPLRPRVDQDLGDPTLQDLKGRGHRSRDFNRFMYRKDELPRTRKAVTKVRRLFTAMHELTSDAGVPLVVLTIPAREQVRPAAFELERIPGGLDLDRPQRIFGDHFDTLGVPDLDLLPLFRESRGDKLLYFVEDNHFTRRGNELAARFLADFLIEQGLVE